MRTADPFAIPGKGAKEPQLVLTQPLPASDVRWGQVLLVVGQPTKLVSKNPGRIGLLILNTSMAAIALDKDGSVNIGRSFLLPGLTSLSLDNFTGETWAIAAVPGIVISLLEQSY